MSQPEQKGKGKIEAHVLQALLAITSVNMINHTLQLQALPHCLQWSQRTSQWIQLPRSLCVFVWESECVRVRMLDCEDWRPLDSVVGSTANQEAPLSLDESVSQVNT